ncbi:MAG: histidine--tRNA ligase [Gemmatimonadota bacterium]
MTFRPLPGFRDFAPADLALRAHLFGAWRRVATRYGFEEYDGPPLEPLELYTAKSGDEIVGQLYNFTDKGGREVALRPEMTPTLARMVSEHANGLKKPIRWFSMPQLFRYERQQRGRLREHFQLNCDLIGEAGALADAEIIALAIDVLRELGLTATDFKVRLSDRRLLDGILDALDIAPPHRPLLMQALDKLGRAEYAGRKQAFLEAAGADRVEALEIVEALRDRRSWSELEQSLAAYPTAIAAGQPLREAVAALEAMGLGEFIELDLSIVRGIAYYTGTVFELFDVQRSLRAICGGGRYDTLLANLGGVDLPALGFGMGDVVLGELLKERGLLPATESSIDVFVTAVTPEDVPHVLAMAHRLRGAGMRTEYAFHATALGKQFKTADARGARLVVVIGPDDRARGEVQLKQLMAKTQESVSHEAVTDRCRELLSGIA